MRAAGRLRMLPSLLLISVAVVVATAMPTAAAVSPLQGADGGGPDGAVGGAAAQDEPAAGVALAVPAQVPSRFMITYSTASEPRTSAFRYYPPVRWSQGADLQVRSGGPLDLINPLQVQSFLFNLMSSALGVLWWLLGVSVMIAGAGPDAVAWVMASAQNQAVLTAAFGTDAGVGGIVASGVLWLTGVIAVIVLIRQLLGGDLARTYKGAGWYLVATGLLLALLTGAALDDGNPNTVAKASPAGLALMAQTLVGQVSSGVAEGLWNIPIPTRAGAGERTSAAVNDPGTVNVAVDLEGNEVTAAAADNALEAPYLLEELLRRSCVVRDGGDAACPGALIGDGVWEGRSIRNAPAAYMAGYHYQLEAAQLSRNLFGFGGRDPAHFGTALAAQRLEASSSRDDVAGRMDLTYAAVSRAASGQVPRPDRCLFAYDGAASAECYERTFADRVLGGLDRLAFWIDLPERDRWSYRRSMDMAWVACRIPLSGGDAQAKPMWEQAFDADLNGECADWWRNGTVPPTLNQTDGGALASELSDAASDATAEAVVRSARGVHGDLLMSGEGGLNIAMQLLRALPVIALGIFVVGVSIIILWRAMRFSFLLLLLPFAMLISSIPKYAKRRDFDTLRLSGPTKAYWSKLADDFVAFATYTLVFAAAIGLARWATGLLAVIVGGAG